MFKKTKGSAKRGLPLIPFLDLKMAVGRNKVNNSEDFAACNTIKEIVNKRNWITVLFGDGVEATKINTEAKITSLLPDEEHWSSG
jgi:hypothetical protein